MPACFLKELTCAIYTILKADVILSGLVNNIYDNVPQKAPYPYIALGRINGTPFNTFDEDGDSMIYNVDIYGKSASQININEIAARVRELLSRQEELLNTNACCVLMFLYDGVVVNPNHNMETEGRLITVEFLCKIL
jgi:hypothetical protein